MCVRTAHLSGESSEYRILSAGTSKQALSHGHPFQECSAQYALRDQRAARLAHLWRLFPSLDSNCGTSVCQRRPGSGTRQHRLRARCLNGRSLSLRIPLGVVPFHKICSQTSSPAGSAWQHPNLYLISDGKLHGVNVLDILPPEAGAFYVMDWLYVDFSRLFTLQLAGDIFAIRAKSNTQYQRRCSRSVCVYTQCV